MSNNNGSGSPFVNKLVSLYLANVDPSKRLDVIETFIDAACDPDVSTKAQNRVAIALDFYAAQNDLNDDDYDEIDDFYERTVEKNTKQPAMIKMPTSESEAIHLLSDANKLQKFIHLKDYLTHLAPDLFLTMLPYYVGEIVILCEEKILSQMQAKDLWRIIEGHGLKEKIQDYFLDTHDIDVEDFTADFFQNELIKNVTLRDNIATDWMIFMQDHSDLDTDELMDRVFDLMSSEE